MERSLVYFVSQTRRVRAFVVQILSGFRETNPRPRRMER